MDKKKPAISYSDPGVHVSGFTVATYSTDAISAEKVFLKYESGFNWVGHGIRLEFVSLIKASPAKSVSVNKLASQSIEVTPWLHSSVCTRQGPPPPI